MLKQTPYGFISSRKILTSALKFQFPILLIQLTESMIQEEDIYSPKESSLKNSPKGPIGRVPPLPCIILQRRVPQNTPLLRPLGLNGFLHLVLFPKGEFLKELSEGSHWQSALITLYYWLENYTTPKKHDFFFLFPKGEFLKELSEGSHWQSAIITLTYPPKANSLELPEGSHCLGTLFLVFLENRFSPPLRPIRNRPVYSVGGWLGGRITFSHFGPVRTIFFKFLVL